MNKKNKSMTVNVKLKDMDIFKQSIELLNEIYQREDIPKDIKDKIINFITTPQKTA
jgi:uncharacterized protein (UPF0147 family)